MDDRTDIIVAGGGLTGPALALALAGAGLRVAVIDRVAAVRRAEPEFDGRAYAVALGSARLLGALGVWRAVGARAQPILDIAVDDGLPGAVPGGAPLLHFDPRETDEGRVGWIVEDRWLRGALLDAMDAAPGVTQIAPADVAGAEYGTAAATVRLADGRTFSAPLVVACDGRRSALAAAAGIRRLRWGYDQTGLVNAVEHELPHHGVAHQSFFPGGPFAVLPLPGDRSSLVWSERTDEADRLKALDDAAFTAEFAVRIGGRLGEIRLVGRRWAYPLDLTLAERYVAPRLALAGDAAHGIHPIAGQGLNIGLRDVGALAEVLVEAARIGEDIGSTIVLERYQRWRRFDATSLALGMDALNRLFSNRDPALKLVRDAGLAAVNRTGALRRAFMREAAGVAGDVPRLLRGRAL
jgi:2-octaprenyl-6-methoxyphenol hydroxylase